MEDKVKEAPELIGPWDPPGFSFRCPRCGKMRTSYSCKHSEWVCFSCGLIFTPVIEHTSNPQELNEECHFCDRMAVIKAMTKMGFEVAMCPLHKMLYER